MSRILGIFAAVFLTIGCNNSNNDNNQEGGEPSAGIAPPSSSSPTSAGQKPEPTVEAATTHFKTAPDQFVFAIAMEPESLDPAKINTAYAGKVVDAIFEGLVEYPVGAGEVVPGVAEKWEISPDGRTYTFFLRKAQWSNGDPITAGEFRFSWIRALQSSDYASILWPIKGAQAFTEKKGLEKDVGIEVVNDFKIKVTLEQPTPYFLNLCAFSVYRPVHQKTVEAHPEDWTRAENIVSNGAFTFKERKGKDHILIKNPIYWDAKQVELASITIKAIEDANTMLNVYESGALDWSGEVDLPSLAILSLQKRSDYHDDPYFRSSYLAINVNDPVLKDVELRRAIARALNPDDLAKVMKMGVGARTLVPPLKGYSSSFVLEQEPDAAAETLSKHGFSKDNPLVVKIIYGASDLNKTLLEMVQSQLKGAGFKVELVSLEGKVWLQQFKGKQYQISRASWQGDFVHPLTFLDMWTTGNGNNDAGWSNKDYDRLIHDAQVEPDPAKQMTILAKAEQMLLDDGVLIPFLHHRKHYMLNPEVQGFEPEVLGNHPVKFIKKT